MNGIAVLTLILIPTAPVPVPGSTPTPVVGKVDQLQAQYFAGLVDNLAQRVAPDYVNAKVTEKELIEGAIRGLYEEAGLKPSDAVLNDIRLAKTANDRIRVLTDARVSLGNHPNLAGSRSLFAAMNGFHHVTDPITRLAGPRATTYASIDQDFGIGIELEGVIGMRWALYQVEHGIASGNLPAYAYFGPTPKPDEVPNPAGFPWRVKRVIPGSPAQKAGIRPGDVISHLNGVEITAQSTNQLFSGFAMGRQAFDPRTGLPLGQDRVLTLRRDGEKAFAATMKTGTYSPESAFGVYRGEDGKWDCMLDRKEKIGYIRLGPIETGLDDKVEEMLAELTKRGCRGLILDLRWCPGGYVIPGTNIAGKFLKPGAVIAKLDYRNKARPGNAGEISAPPGGGKYATLPLVLLVGQETTGGGELIASALRDNDRCVVVGQRTVGRASIQTTVDAGFAGMQFRLTSGASFRPNGKPRQRLPDSKPTDDWGVRPDDGLEVPVTADKSAELRKQADLHALRPADSREALAFDDPGADPYRLAALTYLRKKLGPPK